MSSRIKLKSRVKGYVVSYLYALAKKRLKKLKPDIIGVTGSVGKTSTKDAVYCILARRYAVLRNKKSFNTELGVPLGILEQESGFSSPFAWLEILWKSFKVAFFDKTAYGKVVLEMGVDKPGDMDQLLKLVKPNIGVMTAIKAVHLAEGQFANLEEILKEKSKLVKSIDKNGWAILNADDHYLSSLSSQLEANVITFGTSEKANIKAVNIVSSEDGLKFDLAFDDKNFSVHLPHLIGRHHIYVLLPAIAIGFLNGFKWETIKAGLEDFRLPPGRLTLLPGINKSLIIDGSYNASPSTMTVSLEVLSEMKPKGVGRKIAALGSMNELGDFADSEHRKIGKEVIKHADMLITVGDLAGLYAEEALKGGMDKGAVWSFKNSKEAGEFLKGKLRPGDLVLAKGSQNNVRMECLVKEIMLEPERAKEFLVRQESAWNI